MPVIDRDRGYKALMRRLQKAASEQAVTVGVHDGAGSAAASGGASVADVATIHEFGSGHVPERSFIRAWVDEKKAEYEGALRKIGEALVKGAVSDVGVALGRFGAKLQGDCQKRISGNIPPPLADATVRRKGSSVALIDTGQLRSSITWKVE